MPPRAHTSLSYRPGLDGLRGVAVLAVLVFHLWPSVLKGGWLGVDLFFVLSGYLITSLLVREYSRSGTIDLVGFWLARARRLLPALFVVLLAVVAAASLWTLPSRRESVASDIIAALFYYANWNLLAGDDAYFGAVASPSPLRHTWSLAIEEQYYLLFPLLLLVAARFIHRRRHLALLFAGGALVSASWMAHLYVPGVDPTRVYYGTDTRAFELLIGAAAGALMGPNQWGRSRPTRWVGLAERCAWPALAFLVLCMVLLDENVEFLFRGGLVVFCVVALVPILAAGSPHPNSLSRALSFEPLRRLGLISYGLYLWHWPVHVYLSPGRLGLSSTVAGFVQAAVALALAAATYVLVEKPIRYRTLPVVKDKRFALPIVGVTAMALILVGARAIPGLGDRFGESSTTAKGSAGFTFAAQPYTPRNGSPTKIAMLGNSIPASLVANMPTTSYPDLTAIPDVSFGCTPYSGEEINDGQVQSVSSDCRTFQNAWPQAMNGASYLAYFVSQNLLSDYRVGGRTITHGTPEHDAFVRARLDEIKQRATSQGTKKMAVVTLACHRLSLFGQGSTSQVAMNDTARVRQLNGIVTAWAKSHGVSVIDQYGFLCQDDTFHGTINGTPLYEDGLHFSKDSGPIAWTWFGPQFQKFATP